MIRREKGARRVTGGTDIPVGDRTRYAAAEAFAERIWVEDYLAPSQTRMSVPPKTRRDCADAFSIIELLVVIAIIAILISLLLPAIKRARQSALTVACASNLRQVYFAFQSYLNDNRGTAFWRGADLDTDGMDWYAYGGREAGNKNLDQADFFNRIVPRPLNRYVDGKIDIFRCPCDDSAPWTFDPTLTPYPAESQFDWVGDSYNFNANGYPLRPQPRHEGGLDEVKIATVHDSSNTVLFFDACLYWGFDWHYAHKGSVCFVDGHIIFNPMPAQEGEFHWDP